MFCPCCQRRKSVALSARCGASGALLALIFIAILAGRAKAATSDWEQSPYTVHLTVAVDAAQRPSPISADRIARQVQQHVDRSAAPLWRLSVQVAEDAAARRFCIEPTELPWDAFTDEQRKHDKAMWLGVSVDPAGYRISCREFDAYTRRWGPRLTRNISQATYLELACFDLLTDVFCPLAYLSALPDNDAQVQMVFKGSSLPLQPQGHRFVRAGELFQPLLRRTDRSGKLLEDGVAPVPWTYITAAAEEDGHWLADIHSGTRRPFGVQRARVEQLAVSMGQPPGPTQVRFHARTDKELSLAGYEVFREGADGSPHLIGVTDADGMITIPHPDNGTLSTILLRSEGQVLAKIPVPSGHANVIETPIADNAARLRAYAEAQVIREQLVDVVARRAVMMARIRSYLQNKRVDEAKKLMTELDSLPSSTDFVRSLDALEKRIPNTKDPTVKRSIDTLFTSTRELLGKFLDRRPVNELQTQLNDALAGGS